MKIQGEGKLRLGETKYGTRYSSEEEIENARPKIIWKFLVNRYNEHEIDYAKQLAKQIGVELLFDKMGLADDIPDLAFRNS